MDFSQNHSRSTKVKLPYTISRSPPSPQTTFVLGEGKKYSFSNGYYSNSIYNPDDAEILIFYSNATVTITGRLLEPLFESISKSEVECVNISDTIGGFIDADGTTMIEAIKIHMMG